jgi:hypothetical protein
MANIDAPKDIYQFWIGDELIIQDEDKELVFQLHKDTPSGKGQAPSKRRTLLKCKVIKTDDK